MILFPPVKKLLSIMESKYISYYADEGFDIERIDGDETIFYIATKDDLIVYVFHRSGEPPINYVFK